MSVTLPDPYNLQRFVDAQRDVYARAEHELRAGRKESHWMWFIFPQIQGLGRSLMAQQYAISSLQEAKAYLAHPMLGPRLLTCTRLVTAAQNRSIEDVFGYPDNLKFHSSMTLFARAADDNQADDNQADDNQAADENQAAGDNQAFKQALGKYFRSEIDARTAEQLVTGHTTADVASR
jgi:uncharacterized protein (DUF1810 family)